MGTLAFREPGWAPLAAAAGCLIALALLLAPGAPSPEVSRGGELEAAIAETPLAFEPNAGRTDGSVDYIAHSVAGGSLYLTAREAVLALPQGRHDSRALRLGFPGADPGAEVIGLEELPGMANSFIGDDPSKWRSGIPTYGRVRYESIYPRIDLDFYGNQRDLEYDFRLAPGADPSRIAVEMGGADSLRLARNGDLLIEVGKTTVRQRAPVAYQEIAGKRRPVESAYELRGSTVGFSLGRYVHSHSLVIDPLVLAYSTYLGGGATDVGNGIDVDSAGAAYVTGETTSTDFPTQDPRQTDQPSTDAFVTKLDPDSGGAVTLAYSTYLGGGAIDVGHGIAVDSAGAAYVIGGTGSTDFPTQLAYQNANQGSGDAFVTKLNPDSGGAVTLGFSTYLGGNSNDAGNGGGIALDSAGAVYVTGDTFSTNFPTEDPLQGSNGGNADAFVAKLILPAFIGNLFLGYSTYLGGGGSDLARWDSLAVDSAGAAYVTGQTDSANFPTRDPFQATNQGGIDAFVTKLNPEPEDVPEPPPSTADDVTLAYSTYLGGGDFDQGLGIGFDSSGGAHVTGTTASTNFPTQDAFQGDQGDSDAFVTRLEPDSGGPVTLAYSTYLGGGGQDGGGGIAVDSADATYVTGNARSADFPTQDAFQGGNQGDADAFATKLDPDSGGPVTLAYSTYLGGGAFDIGNDIAVDSAGNAYLTGHTGESTNFPTQGPFQGDQGGFDAFIAKLVLEPPPSPSPEPFKAGRTISFDASKAKKGKKAGKQPLLAVRKGRKARFSGEVSAPQDVGGCESNQAVELQRKKPKKSRFSTFKQLQTDAAGAFSTKKKIKKTFVYRAVVVETAACDDAASQTEKVKAKKKKKSPGP